MNSIRWVELGDNPNQSCRTLDCFWAKVKGKSEAMARVLCEKGHRLGSAMDGGMAVNPVIGRRKSRACDGCPDYEEDVFE